MPHIPSKTLLDDRGHQVPPAELLSDVLSEVLYAVPYSSASQFYEYFGDAPADARFGKSCAWQSFDVGDRLRALGGLTVRYYVDGRHVAAVLHGDDALVVFDPYLLHVTPLRLNRAQARSNGSVVASVDALPVRRDSAGLARPSQVRATWLPRQSRLKLEYLRFSPTRDHYVISRYFVLSTERELLAAPPPADVIRPLLVHPEQNNVSIRVVDRKDDQVRELVYPLTGTDARSPIEPAQLCARDNQGAIFRAGEPGFAATVASVARALQVGADDLFDFVLGAARIYRRVAPADLQLPDYQLVNE